MAEGCAPEQRTAQIALMFEQCAEHGHPKMVGAMFDSDNVDLDEVIRNGLAVLEQIIAAKLAATVPAVRELLDAEHPGGKLDETERLRMAGYIANEVLVKMVRKRSYARTAQFGILPGTEG